VISMVPLWRVFSYRFSAVSFELSGEDRPETVN
jgi:hypothetical protein